MTSFKYMQTFDRKIYRMLKKRSNDLGISVQELLRVKVVPEFLFGPIQLNPVLVRRLVEAGLLKDGNIAENKPETTT